MVFIPQTSRLLLLVYIQMNLKHNIYTWKFCKDSITVSLDCHIWIHYTSSYVIFKEVGTVSLHKNVRRNLALVKVEDTGKEDVPDSFMVP